MALPVNIKELVHGKTIEWERLEFKKGWNPEVVIRSMCAFANDLHNWGGGYIIIGIDEDDGRPILPPGGLIQNQLDSIQKEVLNLGHKISPNYFPVSQPYILEGKHILVLWCPAGDNRPYEAPETLGKGVGCFPYVRISSNSVKAKGEILRQLQELTARIPFDDRVNNRASLNDLDLGLIREYLQEVKSELFEESASMPFPDLCRTMLIAKGPDEDIRPVNIGLLFFSKNPEQFFDRTWIELVVHEDNSGKNFQEKYFKGAIHKQLKEVLDYIKSFVISEQVLKHPDRAESDRFFNYPFNAIEEALSNAVYHKSYELKSPIEVQVFPDKMTILSYPSPVPPVDSQVFSTEKRIIAREYRNRRIGDFLKELKLTEGRGTGFPAIYNALEANGSPEPVFETDDSSYVLVTIPVHSDTEKSNVVNPLKIWSLEDIIAFCNGAGNGAGNGAKKQVNTIVQHKIHDRVHELLSITEKWIGRKELFYAMQLSNQSANRKRYLDPLLKFGWVIKEYPNEDTNPNQRYKTSDSGMRLKKLIEKG